MRPLILLAALLGTLPALVPSSAPAPAFACPDKPTVDNRPWTVHVAALARPSVVEVRSAKADRNLWGAGWAVRADLVVTCAHVVGKKRVVRLVRADGKELTADVSLADPGKDVAFLRPRGKGRMPPLKLAARAPWQGEDVLTLGHPFGYTWTLSRGVVSAVGRTVEIDGHALTDMVQIDAAINSGNSGGPLLNCRGEAVGMACCVREALPGTGWQGLAWCVSAATIRGLVKDP